MSVSCNEPQGYIVYICGTVHESNESNPHTQYVPA